MGEVYRLVACQAGYETSRISHDSHLGVVCSDSLAVRHAILHLDGISLSRQFHFQQNTRQNRIEHRTRFLPSSAEFKVTRCMVKNASVFYSIYNKQDGCFCSQEERLS